MIKRPIRIYFIIPIFIFICLLQLVPIFDVVKTNNQNGIASPLWVTIFELVGIFIIFYSTFSLYKMKRIGVYITAAFCIIISINMLLKFIPLIIKSFSLFKIPLFVLYLLPSSLVGLLLITPKMRKTLLEYDEYYRDQKNLKRMTKDNR